MSGTGEALSDFIKGLYWLLGIMAASIAVLLCLIAWLVLR